MTKTETASLDPAATMAALAMTAPVGAFNVETGGCGCPAGHVTRYPSGPLGTAVAYLPQEKILATGDLVVHPVPFTFDGYPKEWVRTFERLAALGADTAVPGHGEMMHDSRYILQLRDLFSMVVERVEAALDRNPEILLEDVKRMIDLSAQRAAILGDDEAYSAFFHTAMDSLVELDFREAKQR